MSLVEIRRFADVNEAEIARGYLAANGVTAWLAGDHHARVNPLIQQAIGWTRLSVPASQAEEAQSLLEAVGPPPADAEAAVPTHPPSKTLAALTLAGVFLISPQGALGVVALKNRPTWVRNLGVGVVFAIMIGMIISLLRVLVGAY